ncbi:hypothetical protein LCGC14_0532290 [marine sediment metagenome]|uniref:Uncharacterized protein n=1 Tax=marine sediment metagenome TaxID=412755 RepID=A0A0F9RVB8_9ZZZZ
MKTCDYTITNKYGVFHCIRKGDARGFHGGCHKWEQRALVKG